jgi:hypothetical protein
MQNAQAFISVSRNPWHAFAERQGFEEPNLKHTDLSYVFWATDSAIKYAVNKYI